MTRRHAKPDPDTLYHCWNPFASDLPEPRTVVRRGDIIRGDDPIVRAHFACFVPVGEPLPSVQAMAARGLG